MRPETINDHTNGNDFAKHKRPYSKRRYHKALRTEQKLMIKSDKE